MTANQLVRNMQEKQQYHFLPGGYDLEMVTIKTILEQQGIPFSDKQLRWGAKLSAYADVLNDEDHFVGIELIEDIGQPKYYTLIDHHNEFAHLNSSLEQVAALLYINLDREKQLIAANDKGYIPAMIALEATQSEIDEIRQRDRKAQGVSEQDEQLAKESIAHYLVRSNEVIIVKSLTPRFSTITDRLFPFENLLIYNETTLTYYGRNKQMLADHWANMIAKGKAFHGGGDAGYFGFDKGALSEVELHEKIGCIIELINKT